MSELTDRKGRWRDGLFAKYVISLVGLVVFVLAVNGALETWISYRATRTTLTDGMAEKAEATARRIEQSVSELERQISWVTRASADVIEKHHADYAQLAQPGAGGQPAVLHRRQAAANSCGCRAPKSRSAAAGSIFPATRALPKPSAAAPPTRRPISAARNR